MYDSKKLILEAMKEKPMRYSELKRLYPATEAAFLKTLNRFLKEGLIEKTKDGYRITKLGLEYLTKLEAYSELDLGLEVRRLLFALKDLHAFWLNEKPEEIEIKDFVKYVPLILSGNATILVDDFLLDRNSLDNLDILIAKLEQRLSDLLPSKLLKYQSPALKNPATDPLKLEIWILKVYTYEKGTNTFKTNPEIFCSPRISTINKLSQLDMPEDLKSLVLEGINYLKEFSVRYTLYHESALSPLDESLKCEIDL